MSLLTRFDALLDLIAQAWRWLRRRFGKGSLPPVYQTPDGVLVDRIERVPLRSTKADGKRRALAFARQHTGNPRLTWGQARKLIRKLEREAREAGDPQALGEMAVAAEETE